MKLRYYVTAFIFTYGVALVLAATGHAVLGNALAAIDASLGVLLVWWCLKVLLERFPEDEDRNKATSHWLYPGMALVAGYHVGVSLGAVTPAKVFGPFVAGVIGACVYGMYCSDEH